MLKSKVLLALVVMSLCGLSKADDQIDKDLKKGVEKVRTLSIVDAKAGVEKVYAVTAEQAKDLPKGDQTKLSGAEQNKLEKAIDAITKKDPINEVKIAKNKETATSACWGYRRWYGSYYPNYYYPNYYYGGGFYYNNYGYYGGGYNNYYGGCGSVWGYSGYYNYPSYGGCYWGW